jgi:carbonic anhydrase
MAGLDRRAPATRYRVTFVSIADDLIQNNARYADTFPHGNLPTQPARRLCVVTCMDSRIDTFAMLGLGHGEAHILRNAGGIVTEDVVRSLVISQHVLETQSIVVIHHTDCGALKFTDADLSGAIKKRTGYHPPFALGAFTDLDESVRESLRMLQGSAYLVHTTDIRGFVYDVDTGRLREIFLQD